MPETEDEQPQPGIDSLRAIWAAGPEQPPVPWYRRLTGKQVGLAVGTVAALTVAVLAVDAIDSEVEQRRVALPAEFAGLSRVTEDQELAGVRAAYEGENAKRYIPRSLEVVAYGQAGATGLAEAELLVVAMSGSVPDAAQAATWMLGGYSPSGATTLRDGTKVAGLRTFEPGPLGGAIACALLDATDRDIPVCAWADGTTLGSLTDTTADLTLDELADRTRELRERAEHKA
ncbi:hypothetical protein ACIQF6_20910 [Kitasatospora sp. NPDC092948]|uniref:hypothetical protein n=1 Tax=Kitasatospora sp. NPDC092948 TaxID=3364088 RepID=UPI003822CB08